MLLRSKRTALQGRMRRRGVYDSTLRKPTTPAYAGAEYANKAEESDMASHHEHGQHLGDTRRFLLTFNFNRMSGGYQ